MRHEDVIVHRHNSYLGKSTLAILSGQKAHASFKFIACASASALATNSEHPVSCTALPQ